MAGMLQADASQLALAAGGTSTISHGRLEEPDHSSSNWYFSREEIENNSPSRKDSIDLKKETYLRKSYCTFLQDLGMRLKVPQVTIATAIVFCHRFFWRQSHHKNDRYMIATTCMFLAGKVEETPKPLRDVILVSYEIRNKKDPAAVQKIKQKEVYEEQKELVLLGERLVLTTLGFDLNIHHPYKPLVAAIKKFKVAQNALAQVAWNFVNDGLRTSLCLQFKPHHIAAGAIFLAAKFLKVKLPSDGEKAWWQEFEVTPRQLEEVSNQMLELYEQNRETPASRLSDPIVSVGGNNRNKGPLAQTSEVSGSLLTREDYSQAQGRHSSVSVQARQINGVIETSKEELRGCVHEGLGKEYLHSGQHPPNGVVRQDILTKNELKDHQGNAVGFRDSVIKEEQKQMADFWRLRNKSEVSHAVKNEPKDERVSGGAEVDERKESAQLQLLDMQVKEVAEKKLLGELKAKPGVEDYEQKNPFVGLDEANKDRVKAAMEKRRKSRGEGGDVKLSAIKLEPTDEEELLERELENAVEAAAELERAKQEGKDSRTKVSLRAECEASELKRERIEEGVSKRKRSNEEPYPLVDKKRSRSYEKADSIDREYEKFAEGSLDRTEEGELPATNGQDQLRSPKTEKTQAGASPLKKHDHMGRDQHGRRDSSYDLKYRHGHNRDHHHHHPHYQHPTHRVDTDRERNHHEDWQEKDYKKSRHDHAK